VSIAYAPPMKEKISITCKDFIKNKKAEKKFQALPIISLFNIQKKRQE
jgi:hypothetical protein